jgi:hypothetical protein
LSGGGTNANITAVNGAVVYSTASAFALTAAGTSNQVLISNGAAAPTWSSGLTLNAQSAVLINPYGASAGNTSELRFAELAANGTNYVGFKAADTLAANLIWTLPSADGANGQILSTNGSGTLSWVARDYPAQGRLTLSSGNPVPTGDVLAATVLYYSPYVGNQIALYSNSTWNVLTFSEVSLTLSAISGGFSGTKPYDIFGYVSSGALAIEGLAWTSEQVRATGLTRQDGVYVKSGDATRRYLGTIFPSTTSQCEDSLEKRYVWNMYNRLVRTLLRQDSTSSWTYGGAGSTTRRIARADLNNRIGVVTGDPQTITATRSGDTQTNAAGTPFIGIGQRNGIPASSTDFTTVALQSIGSNANMLTILSAAMAVSVNCNAGITTFCMIEWNNGTTFTTTFWGSDRHGLCGVWQC